MIRKWMANNEIVATAEITINARSMATISLFAIHLRIIQPP